jgi:hypothetical protein
MPPSIPLLTMIRLAEDVILEVQKRNCPPVEFFVFSLRLRMWPVFQKSMSDHVDALKKLADGTSSGYFSRAQTTTDSSITGVSFLRTQPWSQLTSSVRSVNDIPPFSTHSST